MIPLPSHHTHHGTWHLTVCQKQRGWIPLLQTWCQHVTSQSQEGPVWYSTPCGNNVPQCLKLEKFIIAHFIWVGRKQYHTTCHKHVKRMCMQCRKRHHPVIVLSQTCVYHCPTIQGAVIPSYLTVGITLMETTYIGATVNELHTIKLNCHIYLSHVSRYAWYVF